MNDLVRREGVFWLILAAMFVSAAVAWGRVEEPVPVHWNVAGEVDRYGSRFEALLLLPLITLGLHALFLVIPRIDPGRANYASFTGPYYLMRLAVILLMGAIHAMMVATALGADVNVAALVPFGVGVMFIVLGNVLGKVRPNYFVGIRTPWTLASTRSWNETHRVGGRWMVLLGAAFVLIGLLNLVGLPLGPEVVALVVGGGVAVFVIGLAVYSYRVWRDDPDPISVTGTRPANEGE